jgi:hypothetical protein
LEKRVAGTFMDNEPPRCNLLHIRSQHPMASLGQSLLNLGKFFYLPGACAPEYVQSARTRRFSDVSYLPESFSTFFFTELLKTGVN